MPESIVCERQTRLVPSITVDIHPTIEAPQPVQKEKEVDTTQEDVEKALGLKITGGVDFNMPITIFHVSDGETFTLENSVSDFCFRSRMSRNPSALV